MSRHSLSLFIRVLAAIALLAGISASSQAQQPPERQGWTILQGDAGLAVDYPAGLFSVSAGPTEKGRGRRFKSEDGRSEFAAYTLDNAEKDSPRAYLRKNLLVPPESLIYRRVTEQFFVMSSIREGRIFYSRCNFALGIHCIFLEYPQDAKRAFDPIVTRVSTSLRPR
jgi:hypothetical protein